MADYTVIPFADGDNTWIKCPKRQGLNAEPTACLKCPAYWRGFESSEGVGMLSVWRPEFGQAVATRCAYHDAAKYAGAKEPTNSSTPLDNLREACKIQCSNGNWNYDPYMHGMANGLIFAVCVMEESDGTPEYLDAPEEWLADKKEKPETLPPQEPELPACKLCRGWVEYEPSRTATTRVRCCHASCPAHVWHSEDRWRKLHGTDAKPDPATLKGE